MGRIVQALEAKIEDGQSSIILTNQLSEFLKIFVKEDQRGITKADFSGGLHLGDIVMKLRRKGFCIHTDMEPNTGEYGGSHARYRLMDKVTYRIIDPTSIPKKKTPLAATKGLSNSKSNGQVSEVLNEASI